MNSTIGRQSLPEFRSLISQFKATGSLGVGRRLVTRPEDKVQARLARESYQEFYLAATELDWARGESRETESREGLTFREEQRPPAEVFSLIETADGVRGARVLVGIDRTGKNGTLDVLKGEIRGNFLILHAYYFASDGSVTQESLVRTTGGVSTLLQSERRDGRR
jgi:hypothetical protein